MAYGNSNAFQLLAPGLSADGSAGPAEAVYSTNSSESEARRNLANAIGTPGTTTWVGFLLKAGNVNSNDFAGLVLVACLGDNLRRGCGQLCVLRVRGEQVSDVLLIRVVPVVAGYLIIALQ